LKDENPAGGFARWPFREKRRTILEQASWRDTPFRLKAASVLAARRAHLESSGSYKLRNWNRPVSEALRGYAALALSADKGAISDISKLVG
jgi:hypothetical protein